MRSIAGSEEAFDRMVTRMPRWLSAFAAVGMLGCAPVMPPMTGGQVAAPGKAQVGFGGAARVPLGALREQGPDLPLHAAAPGGVAPLVQARLGTEHEFDMGLSLMPGLFGVELRRAVELGSDWRIIGSGTLFAGWIDPRDEHVGPRGTRMGVSMPWAIATSIGEVYEVWAGAKVGGEFVRQGEAGIPEAGVGVPAYAGHGVRGGLFTGFAVGFKHVHGLVELSADYEYWNLEGWDLGPPERWVVKGIVLTPAFALRITF